MSGMKAKMMVRTVYGRIRVLIIVGGLSILSSMNFLYFHHNNLSGYYCYYGPNNEVAGTHLRFVIPMTADLTIESAAVASPPSTKQRAPSPPSTKQRAPSWSMNFIEATENEEPQQQQPRHQDGNLLDRKETKQNSDAKSASSSKKKTIKGMIHHDEEDDGDDNNTKRNAHADFGSWDDIELWKGIKGRCGADKCKFLVLLICYCCIYELKIK